MKESYMVPEFLQELLMASDNGMDFIVNKLSQILDQPVLVTDPLFKVLSVSLDDRMNATLDIRMKDTLEESLNQEILQSVISLEGEHFDAIGYPITSKNQILGYLFIILSGKRLLDELKEYESIIMYVSSLCSFHLREKFVIKKERYRFKEAFLFDLLYGNLKKRDDIISYGAIWNWDFTKPHFILIFSLIDYDYYSTDKDLIQTLFYIVEKMLIQNEIEPILFKKQNEVVVILPNTNEKNINETKGLEDFIAHILAQAQMTGLPNRVGVGIGKLYSNPKELFRSYQEAKVAYELGLLLKIKFPFFNNLGIERLLYKHDLQELKEFYYHVLGNLEQYDEQHNGELMYTIENFAKYQFDLKQTSEKLFLHRNTLRYRIKKIEEVLDIKLDDINNRLNITAALKIKQLHKL
ncbi:PucR family transcriptional regulator [Cytobacillus sp. Hz8]|uniref:PucR family transcriptional regulator n=1 Tax=Cytobacillus sp. Hz8 TaxID=3347168 RepID=UPI0035D7FBC1